MDKTLIEPNREPLDLPWLRLVDRPRLWFNPPPWSWERVIPDYYNFWYALEGRGQMWIEGREYSVATGSAFLLAPGNHVRAVQTGESPITNFAAHVVFEESLPEETVASLHGITVPEPMNFSQCVREISARGRIQDPLAKKETATLTFAALARLLRWVGSRPAPCAERVDSLLAEVEANPGQFVDLRAMTARTGISAAHLRRLFLERVGCSPLSYLIQCKMQRAQELLRTSPLRVSEIAHTLGYEDPYYFSRQFRRECGRSPRHWRESSDGDPIKGEIS